MTQFLVVLVFLYSNVVYAAQAKKTVAKGTAVVQKKSDKKAKYQQPSAQKLAETRNKLVAAKMVREGKPADIIGAFFDRSGLRADFHIPGKSLAAHARDEEQLLLFLNVVRNQKIFRNSF